MKARNMIGFARCEETMGSGKTEAYKTSTSLAWARKQGLNCEQDIMSQQLRVECFANTWRALQTVILTLIFLLLCFTGKAEAWSTQDLSIRLASIPAQAPPKVREALPTCAEYVEMDTELRTTGISAVLTRVLSMQGIEGEQMQCMLDHVYKIDMALHNICVADPGPWKEIFVRSVALYSPHCGLEVSP